MRARRLVGSVGLVCVLSGCQGPGVVTPQPDGGPAYVPAGLLSQPDPVPRDEPLSASGNAASYVVFGRRYERLATARDFHATGTASWYGKKFHGRLTASGERYDMYAMTAAHKSLPLPTYVRVTNVNNNRSVVVRVNDRGPFVENRLIDLSYAAAAKLDMLLEGTAPVRIVALSGVPGERPTVASRPAPVPQPLPYVEPQPILSSGPQPSPTAPAETVVATAQIAAKMATDAGGQPSYLQIGAFASFAAADNLRVQVADSVAAPVLVSKEPSSALFRVRVGPFASAVALAGAQQRLRDVHALSPIVVSGSEPKATCC